MNSPAAGNAEWAVIGIGNPDRGDDTAGRLVIRGLHDRYDAREKLIEMSGEPSELLDSLAAASDGILVDACRSGTPPGTIHRFDVSTEPLPHRILSLSTHGLGLAEALELARTLGQLPGNVCFTPSKSRIANRECPSRLQLPMQSWR